MDQSTESLYFFRKIVFALYLEIGSLQTRIHPAIAARADLTNQFFQGEKQRQAAALYHQIETETNTQKIVGPFQERTALTLEDIHQAFMEGNWRNKYNSYTSGGPKWARIAETALELRRLIDQQNWTAASDLLYEIKKLKTNQGFLVQMFEWTERRKP